MTETILNLIYFLFLLLGRLSSSLSCEMCGCTWVGCRCQSGSFTDSSVFDLHFNKKVFLAGRYSDYSVDSISVTQTDMSCA